MRALGQRLRALRETRGETLEQVAAVAGRTAGWLSRLENGHRREEPDYTVLLRLAEHFGLGVDDLVGNDGGSGDGEEHTPRRNADARAGYTPAQIAKIVAYVEAKPGEGYRQRLRAQRARKTREQYEIFCIKVKEAWDKNADLALTVAEQFGEG